MKDLLEMMKRNVKEDNWSLTTFAMLLSDHLNLSDEEYNDFYYMLRNGGEL